MPYRRRKIDLFSTTGIATIRNNNNSPLIALMKDQVDRKANGISLFYQ
jgi:hypothetical protein